MATTDNKKIRCSFCGRTQDKVDKLIAAVAGAFLAWLVTGAQGL